MKDKIANFPSIKCHGNFLISQKDLETGVGHLSSISLGHKRKVQRTVKQIRLSNL